MKINQHEADSPLWGKISAHYEAQLAAHRARLESTACKPEEREHLCWRIQEIKELLSIAIPDKVRGTKTK